MRDILFKTEDYLFSYRVAGICVRDGKVLLQKPTNDAGFAFPGGHAVIGETNAETPVREFKEEIGADVTVGELKWVAEIFFPWGDKPCQQICLFYEVKLNDHKQIPGDSSFVGDEYIEGRTFAIEFHWVPINQLDQINVYPINTVKLMKQDSPGVQHFVYKEYA